MPHITVIPDSVDFKTHFDLSECQGCDFGCSGKTCHCPICPTSKFKPTRRSKVIEHLKNHFHGKKGSYRCSGFIITACPRLTACGYNSSDRVRCHYHCPFCDKTFTKKEHLDPHIEQVCGHGLVRVPASSSPVSSQVASVVNDCSSSCVDTSGVSTASVSTLGISDSVLQSAVQALQCSGLNVLSDSVLRPLLEVDVDTRDDVGDEHFSLPDSAAVSQSSDGSCPAQSSDSTVVDEGLFSSDTTPLLSDDSQGTLSDVVDEAGSQASTAGVDHNRIHPSNPNARMCPLCSKLYHKNYIRSHIRDRHKKKENVISAQHHHYAISIDHEKGIFAVSRTLRGPQHPIHVVKRAMGKSHQGSV